jgi:hypothetical protein
VPPLFEQPAIETIDRARVGTNAAAYFLVSPQARNLRAQLERPLAG